MTKCYKDKERQCDGECEAYIEDKRHNTHCLDLAVQLERNKRERESNCSRDIHSYFMKTLSRSIDSFMKNG